VSTSCELKFQLNQINASKETDTAGKNPGNINRQEQSSKNTKISPREKAKADQQTST